jgi:hypothetical protein
MAETRTERTFGVTATLRPAQRRNLLALINSEVYPDLLDALEMVCIETETLLINTDAADEPAVLANHKMSKAAWQMFIHMQEKIQAEAMLHLRNVNHEPPVPELTPNERLTENILDPTRPAPEEDRFM